MENIDFHTPKQSEIMEDLRLLQSETGKPILIIPLFNVPGTVDVERQTQARFLHELPLKIKPILTLQSQLIGMEEKQPYLMREETLTTTNHPFSKF